MRIIDAHNNYPVYGEVRFKRQVINFMTGRIHRSSDGGGLTSISRIFQNLSPLLVAFFLSVLDSQK